MPSALRPRDAVYTGVFDPIHFGHLDVIGRGSRVFDRLVVGVGINPDKESFFSLEERVDLVRRAVVGLSNVAVLPFTGLAVQFVRKVGAGVMLRGLRTLSDMEYEFSMSLTNLAMDPEIETMFLMAKEQYSHVSSTFVRQIASFDGPLDKFVPPEIKVILQARARERRQAELG
jgi:pantetheine-phosphate adenylyltransferase